MNELTVLQKEAIRVIMEATDEQVANALQLWREWKKNQQRNGAEHDGKI